ncbi:hypothetical protein [Kytococcus sedentarius]
MKNTFTTTGAGGFTTFTLSYSAPTADGWQFIALGDLRVCV